MRRSLNKVGYMILHLLDLFLQLAMEQLENRRPDDGVGGCGVHN